MQVSTRLFYDSAARTMGALGARADTLNTQIATGKRLLQPSDDSAGWQRLQGLVRTGADAATYGANVALAQGMLAQADTTLGSIADQLTRATELAVQAGGGALSAAAREAIAIQIDGLAETIAGLAATRDTRGAMLFGEGDEAPAAIPIGDGQSIESGVPASRFLAGADAALTALSAALRGDGDIAAAVKAATGEFEAIGERTVAAQAAVGARAARLDLVQGEMRQAAIDREAARSGIEDVDVTVTITELQKTMTVLQATQASFSKLSSLSLFDYLR